MPEPDFPGAPETYALRPGEAHVWKFPLATSMATAGKLAALLSETEKERAGRFRFEKEQARFISGRANLRILLSRYIGLAPEKIVFRYEPQGKPMLAGVPGWQFNLSHSRDLAVVAVSRYDAVGIDVELIDPQFPRAEIAPEIFSADELRDLRQISLEEEQARYFFQLWTMKEALLKAVGKGFSVEPKNIHMRLGADFEPEIVSAPPEFNGASLHRLSLQKDFAAALAILARVGRVDFFRFQPAY